MKQLLLLTALVCGLLPVAIAQSVGVGTTTPHPSAALDVYSTTQGLLLPRLTTPQMTALPNATPGLLVFNITEAKFFGYRKPLITGNVEQTRFTGYYNMTAQDVAVGQSFVAPTEGTLTRVHVNMSTVSQATIRVYEGTGNTGTLLGSLTRGTTTGSGQVVDFTFAAGIPLVANRTYTLVLDRVAPSSSTYLSAYMYHTGNLYPDGAFMVFSPGSVQLYPNTDLWFQLYYSYAGGSGEWVPLH